MTPKTIEIPLPAELVNAYNQASEEDRSRIQRWFQFMVEDIASKDRLTLKEIMDEMGRQARENGLTPEILDEILRDDD